MQNGCKVHAKNEVSGKAHIVNLYEKDAICLPCDTSTHLDGSTRSKSRNSTIRHGKRYDGKLGKYGSNQFSLLLIALDKTMLQQLYSHTIINSTQTVREILLFQDWINDASKKYCPLAVKYPFNFQKQGLTCIFKINLSIFNIKKNF